MKKTNIFSIILISAVLLSACSVPIALVKDKTTQEQAPAENAQAALPAQPVNYAPAQPAALVTPPVVSPGEASSLLAAYEGVLISVYEAVNPSVVNIRVVQKASGFSFNLPQMPELPFPFPSSPGMPNNPEQDQSQGQPLQEGLGSGFIWDGQGHIVTNNHVVEGAEKIEITFADGTIISAKLVGADPDSDLAVIKVEAPADKLHPVQLTDSSQVKVGELAIAIGNPFGLQGSMTTGIISAVGRTMPVGASVQGASSYSMPDIIQTDAPINPGNSGGVLVNEQGQVMGVTFAIESPVQASAGVGFVIPSSIVMRVVPALIQDGSYTHTYLGITGGSLTPALAEAMNLKPTQRGALVAEVRSGSPADKAGLRGSDREIEIDGQKAPAGGDVIVGIDSKPVTGMDDIISYLANNTSFGQKVSLSVLRNGKPQEVIVTLEARPDRQAAETPTAKKTEAISQAWLGVTGGSLTPEVAQAMELSKDQTGMLVVRVEAGSPADKAGLLGSSKTLTIDGQPTPIGGDVIIALDGKSIGSIEDLGELMSNYKPGDRATLTILRAGKQIDLEVTMGERPAMQ